METKITQIITSKYQLHIKDILVAPRQFVAETYFILTDTGKYFVKIIDKPLFIPQVKQSLPALIKLKSANVSHIAFPIKTIDNHLYVEFSDKLIVIYDFVEGNQSFSYDTDVLGEINAQVHHASMNFKKKVPLDLFEFVYKIQFETRFNNFLNGNVDRDDQFQVKVLGLFRDQKKKLQKQYNIFQDSISLIKNSPAQLVITHGDSPGNVLVKTRRIVCLIDWDYILFSSPERDTWFYSEDDNYYKGYRKVFPNYRVNKIHRAYHIYNRYFSSMNEYFDEILSEKSNEHKNKMYQQLSENLLNGWLVPYLESVETDEYKLD